MNLIRKALRIPFGIPMPGWWLKRGAILIKKETGLILKSRLVVPRKLLQDQYTFLFPTIETAIKDTFIKPDKL